MSREGPWLFNRTLWDCIGSGTAPSTSRKRTVKAARRKGDVDVMCGVYCEDDSVACSFLISRLGDDVSLGDHRKSIMAAALFEKFFSSGGYPCLGGFAEHRSQRFGTKRRRVRGEPPENRPLMARNPVTRY